MVLIIKVGDLMNLILSNNHDENNIMLLKI
jgi:hypothetical protein